MKKEWFSTKELVGVGGLPTSSQGVNQKARREEWQSRKREGVQGKAIEYHINSLPEGARQVLFLKDINSHYNYYEQDLAAIWHTTYQQLTVLERQRLIKFIIQYGFRALIELISQHEASLFSTNQFSKQTEDKL